MDGPLRKPGKSYYEGDSHRQSIPEDEGPQVKLILCHHDKSERIDKILASAVI